MLLPFVVRPFFGFSSGVEGACLDTSSPDFGLGRIFCGSESIKGY